MKKIPVGILGATGMVGQQYLQLLADHPWFEIVCLAASDQSSGKTYDEAVKDRWQMSGSIPQKLSRIPVHRIDQIDKAIDLCRFVFSALTTDAAKLYEESYAAAGLPVVSNAGYHRTSSDVPMLIPEINPEHTEIIPHQQRNRGWNKGIIVVKPNCSIQSYIIPLYPLHKEFQVQKIIVTTMQAISGAGFPGVPSLQITENVIPYIGGEEGKSEQEPLKIFGRVQGNRIEPAQDIVISAHCNRVPVVDGHMACVSVKFAQKPKIDDILALWESFEGLPQKMQLPTAPRKPIIYMHEENRPQPRLDRLAGQGMSVTVGRLRECNIFDYRFTGLSHNTIRGAAGGGILNAELLARQNLLGEIC
jgi:aspartate-semialdehyde dehydrogenase